MKLLLSAIVLLSISNVFAAAKDRPSSIKCDVIDAIEGIPSSFKISKLNTLSPTSDIDSLVDSLEEENPKKSDSFTLFYSNECDNGFEVTLSQQNLKALKEKKVESITGLLEGGDMEIGSAKYTIVCKLK